MQLRLTSRYEGSIEDIVKVSDKEMRKREKTDAEEQHEWRMREKIGLLDYD